MAVVQAGSNEQGRRAPEHRAAGISRSVAGTGTCIRRPLLERTARASSQPSTAAACSAGGTAVFDDLRQTVKNVESSPTTLESCGSGATFLPRAAAAAIDRLSRRYPRIVFRLATGYVETSTVKLTDRNVDLLIHGDPAYCGRSTGYEFLFDESYSVAVGVHQSVDPAAAGSTRPVGERPGCCRRGQCARLGRDGSFRASGSISPHDRGYRPREARLSCWRRALISIFPTSYCDSRQAPENKGPAH